MFSWWLLLPLELFELLENFGFKSVGGVFLFKRGDEEVKGLLFGRWKEGEGEPHISHVEKELFILFSNEQLVQFHVVVVVSFMPLSVKLGVESRNGIFLTLASGVERCIFELISDEPPVAEVLVLLVLLVLLLLSSSSSVVVVLLIVVLSFVPPRSQIGSNTL